MAKKGKKTNRTKEQDDLVKVDIFYIPQAQAEMYQVLREAIATDTEEILKEKYHSIGRVQDEEEGEAIVAYDSDEKEVARLYLNPTTISQGQSARDKGQLEKFLETHLIMNQSN